MLGSGGVRKFSLRRASADEKRNKSFEMSDHINDPGSERTTKTRFCCVHELFSFLLAAVFMVMEVSAVSMRKSSEDSTHSLLKQFYGRREAFY